MASTGVDIVSLDWTVDMAEALARLPEHVGVQGNVDPGLLFGTPEAIEARIDDCVRKAAAASTSSTWATASCREHLRRMAPPSSGPARA